MDMAEKIIGEIAAEIFRDRMLRKNKKGSSSNRLLFQS